MVTILIAEDDRMIWKLTAAQLSGFYQILEAQDGEDALLRRARSRMKSRSRSDDSGCPRRRIQSLMTGRRSC